MHPTNQFQCIGIRCILSGRNSTIKHLTVPKMDATFPNASADNIHHTSTVKTTENLHMTTMTHTFNSADDKVGRITALCRQRKRVICFDRVLPSSRFEIRVPETRWRRNYRKWFPAKRVCVISYSFTLN